MFVGHLEKMLHLFQHNISKLSFLQTCFPSWTVCPSSPCVAFLVNLVANCHAFLLRSPASISGFGIRLPVLEVASKSAWLLHILKQFTSLSNIHEWRFNNARSFFTSTPSSCESVDLKFWLRFGRPSEEESSSSSSCPDCTSKLHVEKDYSRADYKFWNNRGSQHGGRVHCKRE